MDKVSTGIVSLAFLAALAATLAAPAAASLFPTTFGFPVMVKSGQSVAFNSDFASSTDSELMGINFPAFDGLMSSAGTPSSGLDGWTTPGMAMPDMGQMASLFDFQGFNFI